MLHAPSGATTTWKTLKGQVVVLDFWATWCGPCRKALPHWNELVDAFKDEPVRFIAITDENEQVVQNFLKQTPIHSWVGLDGAGRSNRDGYNIEGIPTTVIVNQEGVVVAVVNPAKLQPKHIDEILRTGQSSLPPPTDLLAELGSEMQVIVTNKPMYEVSVRRSGPVPKDHGIDCWAIFRNSADLTGEYASVKQAILMLFDGRPSLLDCRVALPVEQYDFTVKLPPSATPADREQAVAPLFRDLFGLYVRREFQQRDAYILTVASTNAPGLVPFLGGVRAGGGSERGGLKLKGATFDWLPGSLEELLGKPVLNETGVTNLYDIHLKWKMSEQELNGKAGPDPDAIIAAIRQQLGLNLSLQRRSLPVLIVDQARAD